jgi:pimeloyl-ACP methyl ester carboxylesterase
MGTVRLRDLVILLPGLTGSVLRKGDTDIWGVSGRFFWDVATSGGENVRQLALTNGDDPQADDLDDGVTATRLIPDAAPVPGLVKIDGYTATAQMIRDRFRVEEGTVHDNKPANFIEFPYDWRRDNRVAARFLKALVDSRLALWRKYSGAADAKVILLAHSMGGLVARYYLEALEGWPDCRLLITLGTPFRGSLNAVNFLANGYKLLTVDMTEPMRTFTGIHQLFPIYPAVRAGIKYRKLTEKCSWPACPSCNNNAPAETPFDTKALLGVETADIEKALGFHHEIMEAVERHGKDPSYRERRYKVIPIVGTRQPTNQSAELLSGQLTVSTSLPEGIDPLLGDGDGTVPRLSAIPVELSEDYRQSFYAERHGSLQRNETVLARVYEVIEQAQVMGLKEIREADVDPNAAEAPAISVALDDLYREGEPVRIRAALVHASTPSGPPLVRLQAIGQCTTREEVFRQDSDGWVVDVTGLTSGLYRAEVRAPSAGGVVPLPVHDLFEVAPTVK